jgi:hypothetical protein
MKYWTYVEPTDEADFIVTMSEKEILDNYFEYWYGMMAKGGKDIPPEGRVAEEMCIGDWVVIHWATETDENGLEIES